jgi:hypothetical protein
LLPGSALFADESFRLWGTSLGNCLQIVMGVSEHLCVPDSPVTPSVRVACCLGSHYPVPCIVI